MKKLVIVLAVFCLLLPCAHADELTKNLCLNYQPCATTFGAPTFENEDIAVYSKSNHTYIANAGLVSIIFEFTPTNSIRSVLICAKDDECVADFLCSCMAVISYLGEIDTTAFGCLLNSFGLFRGLGYSLPISIGIDTFDLTSTDEYKYVFYYANNDLSAHNDVI